jgi:hypothetical protein
MYKYLTTPDNYKAAKEVSGLISKVDERLVTEFWAEVWQKLEVRLNDLKNDKANIYVVKDEIICKPKKNIAAARQLVEQKDKVKLGLQSSSAAWPCWITIPFITYGEYLNKLPNTRETKVSELVEIFSDYVKIASDVCDEIGKQT